MVGQENSHFHGNDGRKVGLNLPVQPPAWGDTLAVFLLSFQRKAPLMIDEIVIVIEYIPHAGFNTQKVDALGHGLPKHYRIDRA